MKNWVGTFIHLIFHLKYPNSQKSLGILNKLKFMLPRDALLTLYRRPTMIEPHLLYCNILWGGTSQIALVKFQHLQKRAICLLTFSTYRAPTNELFLKLRLIKLYDMFRLQLGLFMFKTKNNLLPLSFEKYVKRNVPNVVNRYCLRTVLEFIPDIHSTNVQKRCIAVCGPSYWNSLPDVLRKSINLNTFNKHFYNYLLDCYTSVLWGCVWEMYLITISLLGSFFLVLMSVLEIHIIIIFYSVQTFFC